MYIHSVYKESSWHYLSIEIKNHKFWKFETHLYYHHSSKPGYITGKYVQYVFNSELAPWSACFGSKARFRIRSWIRQLADNHGVAYRPGSYCNRLEVSGLIPGWLSFFVLDIVWTKISSKILTPS